MLGQDIRGGTDQTNQERQVGGFIGRWIGRLDLGDLRAKILAPRKCAVFLR
jgi:hypothetical protein